MLKPVKIRFMALTKFIFRCFRNYPDWQWIRSCWTWKGDSSHDTRLAALRHFVSRMGVWQVGKSSSNSWKCNARLPSLRPLCQLRDRRSFRANADATATTNSTKSYSHNVPQTLVRSKKNLWKDFGYKYKFDSWLFWKSWENHTHPTLC